MTTIKFNDLLVSDHGSDRGCNSGHVKSGPRAKKISTKPGDWTCPDRVCGGKNFSWRNRCFKCQKCTKSTNPMRFRVASPEFREKPPNSNAKSGDWTCPTRGCGNTSDFFLRKERPNCSKTMIFRVKPFEFCRLCTFLHFCFVGNETQPIRYNHKKILKNNNKSVNLKAAPKFKWFY